MIVDRQIGDDQVHEADCRAGQPRPRVPRHASQRRLHGGRRDRAASRPRLGDGAVAGARRRSSSRSSARTPVLLAKPLTFMNRSGDAVAALARYYDIAPADLLVVVDEVDLPFGRLRARARGSGGTHNGLKSLVERLGTTEFPRLRLGVGRGDTRRDLADHVLSKFERRRTVGARRVHRPGGRRRRDVRRGRHRQGDERAKTRRPRLRRQPTDSLPPDGGRECGRGTRGEGRGRRAASVIRHEESVLKAVSSCLLPRRPLPFPLPSPFRWNRVNVQKETYEQEGTSSSTSCRPTRPRSR